MKISEKSDFILIYFRKKYLKVENLYFFFYMGTSSFRTEIIVFNSLSPSRIVLNMYRKLHSKIRKMSLNCCKTQMRHSSHFVLWLSKQMNIFVKLLFLSVLKDSYWVEMVCCVDMLMVAKFSQAKHKKFHF